MKVLTYSDCESVMGKYDTQPHSKVVFINQPAAEIYPRCELWFFFFR